MQFPDLLEAQIIWNISEQLRISDDFLNISERLLIWFQEVRFVVAAYVRYVVITSAKIPSMDILTVMQD